MIRPFGFGLSARGSAIEVNAMDITHSLLKELFAYQDGRLINRFTRSPRAVAGTVAGSVNPSTGYWRVCIGKRTYQLSRVIWLWHHGSINPNWHIDHIDGDVNNNCIENLRHCPQIQNEWNKKVAGVSFEKGKWRARFKCSNKSYHVGLFNTFEAAKSARDAAVIEMRGELTARTH